MRASGTIMIDLKGWKRGLREESGVTVAGRRMGSVALKRKVKSNERGPDEADEQGIGGWNRWIDATHGISSRYSSEGPEASPKDIMRNWQARQADSHGPVRSERHGRRRVEA